MKNVTLRQLKVFEAVARHLSFSRAAEELHLTQPAVSMQVRQLEESVGLPLTEQVGKRIFLTSAGTELVRHARLIQQQLREAEATMGALRGVGGGLLNIAVVSTAKYFAPRLLATFRASHPGVEVRLAVHNREDIVHQLQENLIDLAIMGRPPQEFPTEAHQFAEHPLVFIAPPDHPLAGERTVELAELSDESFIIREGGSGTRTAMEGFFAESAFIPKATLEMASNETIKQAVMAGMGVAFISGHTIGLETATGRLVRLPVRGTPVLRWWFVVHRAEKRLLPVAEAFRVFLAERGAEIIAEAANGKTRAPQGSMQSPLAPPA